jgi:hypothetical protein
MNEKFTSVCAMMIQITDLIKFMKLTLDFCIYIRYFHCSFIILHITSVNHSGSYKNSNTVLHNYGSFLIIPVCQFLFKTPLLWSVYLEPNKHTYLLAHDNWKIKADELNNIWIYSLIISNSLSSLLNRSVRTIKLKIFCPVLCYVKSFFICKP